MDGVDLRHEGLALDREIDELLVELGDAGAGGVFAGEEVLLADVGEAAGVDAEGDEVAAVDVGHPGFGQVGVGHGWGSPAWWAAPFAVGWDGRHSADTCSLQEPDSR